MSETAGKPAETVAEKTVRGATLGAPTSKRKSPQRGRKSRPGEGRQSTCTRSEDLVGWEDQRLRYCRSAYLCLK